MQILEDKLKDKCRNTKKRAYKEELAKPLDTDGNLIVCSHKA